MNYATSHHREKLIEIEHQGRVYEKYSNILKEREQKLKQIFEEIQVQ